MKNGFETISSHALVLRIVGIVVACALLLAVPATVHYFQRLAIVYQPVDACNLLTEDTAKTLLHTSQVINNRSAPTINTDTNIGVSKCSYSDTNTDNMSVVAIAVESGTNDKGVVKLKSDFAANQKANQVETVSGIGDAAYYTALNGQLQVLKGRQWYIFNRSSGDNPANTTKEQLVDFAKTILKIPSSAS